MRKAKENEWRNARQTTAMQVRKPWMTNEEEKDCTGPYVDDSNMK
jgi:hypothetical protein